MADWACESLGKRAGTKFRFRRLAEDPKSIIPYRVFCYEEEGRMMKRQRQDNDNIETPEPSQPPLLFALREEIPREDIVLTSTRNRTNIRGNQKHKNLAHGARGAWASRADGARRGPRAGANAMARMLDDEKAEATARSRSRTSDTGLAPKPG